MKHEMKCLSTVPGLTWLTRILELSLIIYDSLSSLQMEGGFAEELYAESIQMSKLKLRSTGADDQENKLNGKILYG